MRELIALELKVARGEATEMEKATLAAGKLKAGFTPEVERWMTREWNRQEAAMPAALSNLRRAPRYLRSALNDLSPQVLARLDVSRLACSWPSSRRSSARRVRSVARRVRRCARSPGRRDPDEPAPPRGRLHRSTEAAA
jgi:hypothetical protein